MRLSPHIAALLALFLATPRQCSTQESNRRPTILTKPMLHYPGEAQVAGIEGTITLRALVGSNGIVVKTEILERDPELAYVFDEEARRYVMGLTFSPATDSSGKPIKRWVSIPVHFSIPEFEPAVLIESPTPEYPAHAKELGMEGWVGVAVQVDEMGYVVHDPKPIIIAREHENMTLFDNSAIDAARSSRFTPAHGKDGKQKSWAYVKIEFRIHDE
jgi:TonB family protein